MDVARIESGKHSIVSEKVNVKKLIGSVIETLSSSAKEKGIELTVEDIDSNMYIQGDEKRLYQAFTNLVSNSIKYTKRSATLW